MLDKCLSYLSWHLKNLQVEFVHVGFILIIDIISPKVTKTVFQMKDLAIEFHISWGLHFTYTSIYFVTSITIGLIDSDIQIYA